MRATLLPRIRAPTHNPEVYEAYLKGSSLWKKLKPPDLDAAQRYFEQALVKDPSYAPAHAGLAWVWTARGFPLGLAPLSETGPKAKAAVLQALSLEGNSSEAHEALAAIRTWYDWDWAGAEPEWRRALELNPSSGNAHAYHSHFLARQGRGNEGRSSTSSGRSSWTRSTRSITPCTRWSCSTFGATTTHSPLYARPSPLSPT